MFCMMRSVGRDWVKEASDSAEMNGYRKTLMKLIVRSLELLLDRAFIPRIGEHSENFVAN